MELLSRGVFKENALLGLVDKCGIKDDLFTCFEVLYIIQENGGRKVSGSVRKIVCKVGWKLS